MVFYCSLYLRATLGAIVWATTKWLSLSNLLLLVVISPNKLRVPQNHPKLLKSDGMADCHETSWIIPICFETARESIPKIPKNHRRGHTFFAVGNNRGGNTCCKHSDGRNDHWAVFKTSVGSSTIFVGYPLVNVNKKLLKMAQSKYLIYPWKSHGGNLSSSLCKRPFTRG